MVSKFLPFTLILTLACAPEDAPTQGDPASSHDPLDDESTDQPVTTTDAGTVDAGSAASCAPITSITPSATVATRCAASTYSRVDAIRYASSSPTQVLDLYRPTSGAGPFPTIIWIHGGGWQSGTRANVAQILNLVCQGYAIASIDYRLSGEAIFPAQIYDVKAAIRFLRANAATYNLARGRFVAAGSSAGGHLAALAGTSGGVAALEDLSLGNSTFSSRVQAVIAWYGPSDLSQMDTQLLDQGCGAGNAHHNDADSGESRFLGCALPSCDRATLAAVNPITHVGRNDPPFMILHGSADCTVPTAQSRLLRDALVAAGHCPQLGTVVGAGHGGAAWTSPEVQATSAEFLRLNLP